MSSNLILELKVGKNRAIELKNSVLYHNYGEALKYNPVIPNVLNNVSGLEQMSNSISFVKNSSSNSSNLYTEIYRDYDNSLIQDYKTICTNKLKDWPQRTNLKCWHCTLHFDTIPCKIPYKYDDETDIFYVYGCFCSFNCALAYNSSKNLHKDKIDSLIHLLYKKLHNGKIKYINPAPDKELLKEYGGNLTPEEYKLIIKDNLDSSKVLLPPIIDIGYTTGIQNMPNTEKNQSLGSMLGYPLINNYQQFDSNSVMNNFIQFK